MTAQIPLIVLAGPTGVGKTDLSLDLAHRFKGQIINADSMQIYQGLTIGTGKITPEQMQGIPHHLIDICDPSEAYDASRFRQDATRLIKKINDQGNLPILVGGTGLYLEGLLYDLSFGGEHSFDPAYRHSLESRLQVNGAKSLWIELEHLDPLAAAKIPWQNSRRVIRALEVIQQTGCLFSSQDDLTDRQSRFDELLIILNRPREALYQRINQRVEQMVADGLEIEARYLFERHLDPNLSSMKGIGYKEWFPYFEGAANLEETIALIQQNSRRYAKRQLTWFRNRMKDQHWLDVSQADYLDQAEDLVEHFLKQKREIE